MKAFLLLALIVAFAVAGGYLKGGEKIGAKLADAYDGNILNNPWKIYMVVAQMPFAWFACTWSSFFGGDYKNCVYTHMYYALA
jgi:hypothetical protein